MLLWLTLYVNKQTSWIYTYLELSGAKFRTLSILVHHGFQYFEITTSFKISWNQNAVPKINRNLQSLKEILLKKSLEID